MLLTRRSQLDPDRIGLVFEGQTFTYREFNERCNRWAHAFADLGVEKGNRIGILLKNCNEFLEAYFGLAKIGCIIVPLNWRLTPQELEYICKDSGLRGLTYGEEFSQTVEAIRPKLGIQHYFTVGASGPPWAKDSSFVNQFPATEPEMAATGEDPALLLYTAGTTGYPKGAVRLHESLFWLSIEFLLATDMRSEDRVLAALPLFHIGGLALPGMANVHKGCTTVLMKDSDPLRMLEALQKETINGCAMVPTMLQRMTEVPDFVRYLKTVRWIVTGAAPLPVPLIRTYTSLGVKVAQAYGSTEGGMNTFIGPEKSVEKPRSVGLPFFHHQIRVVDEKGTDTVPGEVGEILVKGPSVMKEYWNNSQATKEATRDGWYCTGDLGRLDEDGYLYIVDRKTDMIKSGAEKIYPIEVENVLCEHPKIAEVAVIGQEDEIWGERVCAVVRPKAGEMLTPEEVIGFCRGKLARYKIPKHAILREQPLPRNAAGKVLKRALREEYAG
jgi:acyl-CoA synthetase (AMP-forming)/AMP-acid ligase II